MKFSLRWLKDYVDITLPADELFERLTLAGNTVEGVEKSGLESPHIVVGQIVSFVPHPNADRLRVCRVNDGQGERQVVCGAKNFKAGDKIPLALPGARFSADFVIKESKLRGELSQGMCCSAEELGLAKESDGILILPEDAPVGKLFHEYQPGDTLFEVEVTPNRPDLLSYLGMAREVAAIGAGTLKTWPISHFSASAEANSWSLKLDAPEIAPFYSATHLVNVKVGPSPQWLADKISAMGHKPINNVVDITNFVLWETGQPLHAFDVAKLHGKTIHARHAATGEKFAALDEKTYDLLVDDIVIADEAGAVALAGVMGGLHSGVTESATEILLEAAWFKPQNVRRTSRRLGLMSDSSYHYERRVDAGFLTFARDRAIQLLTELAGAQVVGSPRNEGTLPIEKFHVALRPAAVDKLMGAHVPVEKIEQWLTGLGLHILSRDANAIQWEVPSFRHDLDREVDLIEEIARLHGLTALPSTIHFGINPESKADRHYNKLRILRKTLAARGWDECITDSLVDKKFADPALAVTLTNPLNEQYTQLRTSLKNTLLAVAARNLSRGAAGVQLFETGRVYVQKDGATAEPMRLGLLVAGEIEDAAWWRPERKADLFDLKAATDFLQCLSGLPAKAAIEIGKVGAADLKLHGIKTPVFYAEYDLTSWIDEEEAPAKFKELPQFPAMRRDLAVVVPRDLPHEQVRETIRKAHIPGLISIDLFDIFLDEKGEKIPADKKSLAYALTYRDSDRTLTEKEVNAWHDKVRKALQTALGCSFRDN
jgi:phenylalanyl-tRNA synthetase beta chain